VSDETTPDAVDERRMEIRRVFRPTAPVSTRDLFAGRIEQMEEVLEVAYQPGQHAAIYGERGVGKTSLAAVMSSVMEPQAVTVKVNCSVSDSFDQIWRRVMGDIQIAQQRQVGFSEANVSIELRTLGDYLASHDRLAPDDVRRTLALVAHHRPVVVFLDEFDRLRSDSTTAAMADTLKTLSDQDVDATVIIVGVADNVDELIREHRSTERALAQIHMPRMEPSELEEIILGGLTAADMRIKPESAQDIIRLSQGLPHYTHLITQNAAHSTLNRGTDLIEGVDVIKAVTVAIDKAQQSVRESYRQATTSNRKDSLYQQVLLACALAPTDAHGFFAAADLRGPLSKILNKDVDIPAFAQHLKAFSGDGKREPVLQKRGTSRRFRYRFVNPLLQPYVVMKGMKEQMIRTEDLVRTR